MLLCDVRALCDTLHVMRCVYDVVTCLHISCVLTVHYANKHVCCVGMQLCVVVCGVMVVHDISCMNQCVALVWKTCCGVLCVACV